MYMHSMAFCITAMDFVCAPKYFPNKNANSFVQMSTSIEMTSSQKS